MVEVKGSWRARGGALARLRPVIDSKKIDLPDNPSFQDVLKARQAVAEAAS